MDYEPKVFQINENLSRSENYCIYMYNIYVQTCTFKKWMGYEHVGHKRGRTYFRIESLSKR